MGNRFCDLCYTEARKSCVRWPGWFSTRYITCETRVSFIESRTLP